jgi:hypothetical protein
MTLARLGITPGVVPPTPWGRPSPSLYTMRRGQCQPRGTVPPTSVRLTRRALEGGPAEPSNGGECFFYDYTGLRRDVRPAGTVFSVAVNPVRPSSPLQRHAGYCDDIPDTVGAHGDGTSLCLPLCLVRTPRRRHPRTGPRAVARRPTSTRPPSKPLLYGPRTRHDAPTGARFARTVVNSVALLSTPPHIGE